MKKFNFRLIKTHREAAGLTQFQLASHIGVMVQQVSAWERSGPDKSITVTNLQRIAEALGKTTDDFFEEKGGNVNTSALCGASSGNHSQPEA